MRVAFAKVLWGLVGYCTLSCLTLPFISRIWLGEIPLLALVQLPKIPLAQWIRHDIVMKALPALGLSHGAYSLDTVFARPYALAVVYLIPLVIIGLIAIRIVDNKIRRATVWLVIATVVDYAFTLQFADARDVSLY